MDDGKRFTSSIYDVFGKKGGIYALLDDESNFIYVGISGNLANRAITHILNKNLGDREYKDVSRIVMWNADIFVHSVWAMIEMAVIDKTKPPMNFLSFNFKDWYYSMPEPPEIDIKTCLDFANTFTSIIHDISYIDINNLKVVKK